MKFDLKIVTKNNSDEELIKDVIYVANLYNQKTVTMEQYNEFGKFHSTTLTRRFESWSKVLLKASLLPSRSKINISNEELFNNLYNVWLKLGRQPCYKEFKKPLSLFSAGTYENRFGSWNKALEKFIEYVNQLEKPSEQVINSEQQIIEDIKFKIKKHKTKRDPTWRLRFLVLKRDNFTCVMCGHSPIKNPEIELHVDHIKPWSKGEKQNLKICKYFVLCATLARVI